MRLSQAAFLATVFYASAIAFERLAGCAPAWGSGVPTFTIHIATLAVALAGVAVPSHPYAYLARRLLPTAIYECVGPSGVLSGECVGCRPQLKGCLSVSHCGAAPLHGALTRMRWRCADFRSESLSWWQFLHLPCRHAAARKLRHREHRTLWRCR